VQAGSGHPRHRGRRGEKSELKANGLKPLRPFPPSCPAFLRATTPLTHAGPLRTRQRRRPSPIQPVPTPRAEGVATDFGASCSSIK
jgi:hypothetical protein